MISPLTITEYVEPEKQKIAMPVPPYYFFKGQSAGGPAWLVPAEKVLPWMDKNLDRCKGKNELGE
jgi:hypothetical protein